MKKIITAAVMMAAMATATAQTVKITTANGEIKTYNLSQIESISFSNESRTEALVDVDIVNTCALAFDIKVDKSSSCQRYMVAAFHKDVYNENSFIEQAEQTLSPNAYYRPFAQTLSYNSDLFSEAQSGLNAVMSEDGKSASQFVAAVYAIDDMGETKVYTKEFSLPIKPTVESAEQATVTIDEKTLTYNHIDYTVRSGWNTKKIIIGATTPTDLDSKLTPAKWNAMSESEQTAKILSVFQGIPETYKSGMKGSYSCSANSTCIIYAIPIDNNGKIGKMGITTVQTSDIPLEGKGAFTGASAIKQTAYDSYSFKIAVDNNAVAYRLMWFTETDEKNSDYIKRLPELFFDSKYQTYGMWQEFSATDEKVTLDVWRPGDNHYLYGVTVDRFGNISKPVNLGETYLGTKTIATMAKPDED